MAEAETTAQCVAVPMSCLISPGSAGETKQLRRVGSQTSLQLCSTGAIASWEAGGSCRERRASWPMQLTSLLHMKGLLHAAPQLWGTFDQVLSNKIQVMGLCHPWLTWKNPHASDSTCNLKPSCAIATSYLQTLLRSLLPPPTLR